MREIGSRVEMFIDDWLIDRLRGARLRLHAPEKREVVLEMNAVAEDSNACYFNFFEDDGRIRMYYRGYASDVKDRDEQTANTAESADGVHFTRPKLGIVPFKGSAENHVVYQGREGHNFCAFRDDNPACPPDQRYKAVGGEWMKLCGFVSPDGYRWRKIREEPLEVAGAFDSLNVAFWDGRLGCYRLFSRFFLPPFTRCIQSSVSDDFIHWSDPVPHAYAPEPDLEQYYTNATVPCPGAEHILLSFPKRFVPDRTKIGDQPEYAYQGEGISDAVLLSSRDGVHWHRFREAWVRPGLDERNWTHRNNMVARGIARTSPREWSMYVSEHYAWTTNRLRRLAIRPFGFASLHADFAGGSCLTHPLTFTGARLHLNYATSAAGSLRVEVREADGTPIPGFRRRDMAPLYGDELDSVVQWKGGDLSALQERPVCLKVELKDADLYALRFGE
ncbi:MAG: glycoside hydrolase family protein [Armatimonadota bacterium]